MNVLKLVVVSIFLIASGNLLAAKQPKLAVCHVGGDGEINLLVVSANSNHLGNASHSYDGILDYEPSEVGATGIGTEDFDGDGVDEGCEPPVGVACPCWEEGDLQAVTAENQNFGASCDLGGVSFLPFVARVENSLGFGLPERNPEIEGGFTAADFGDGSPFCQTRDYEPFLLIISGEEAASCIEHIVDRCEAIGSPIPPAGS